MTKAHSLSGALYPAIASYSARELPDLDIHRCPRVSFLARISALFR
jgi:hypothetical protein